jgi:hypothetical protein
MYCDPVLRTCSLSLQEIIILQGNHCYLVFVHTEDDGAISIETLLS